MAAAAPPSEEKCPLCHDDFTDPKILPCLHLVCGQCLLSWLQAGGHQAGCPLCRAALQPRSPGQDLASLVDDLPTDIITKAAVDSRRILNEKHMCICDSTTKATSFCMQCSMKLCPKCVKTHRMIPATRDHELEPISSLTVDKLASSYLKSSCTAHPGRQVQQFCSLHQQLICTSCSTSAHRACPDVEEVAAAARVRRQKLKKRARQLGNKKQEIQMQIPQLDVAAADAQKKFKAMKDKAKTNFDELRRVLDKCCDDVTADIQKKEEDYLRENKRQREELEKEQARCAASSNTVSLLVAEPDDMLLAMLLRLQCRLQDAELLCRQAPVAPLDSQPAPLGDFSVDPQSTARLKKLIALHGQMTHPAPPKSPSRKAQTECTSASACDGPLPQKRFRPMDDLTVSLQPEEPSAFRFHSNHGGHIVLSNNQHTAERTADIGHGIVMSVEPMEVNMLYEVRVDETLSDWGYQRVYLGVMTQSPDSLTLPTDHDGWSGNMASAVVVNHDWIRVNGVEVQSDSSVGEALRDVREGGRVGLALDDQHSLHLYIDCHSQGVVASGITHPCYFMVDLCAHWKKVTALPVRPVT